MNQKSRLRTIAWLIFVISASANYVVPLFPLYQHQLQLKTGTITFLFSVYLLSLIPLLMISDKLSRFINVYYLAGLSLLMALTSSLVGIFSDSFMALVIIRILQGGAVGLFMGILNPFLMDNITLKEQTKGAKITGVMTLLGFGSGPLICSIVAQSFLSSAFVSAYITLGVLVAVAIIAWLTLRVKQHPIAHEKTSTDDKNVKHQLPSIFWQVITPTLFVMYALNGPVLSLLPSYTRQLLHSNNLVLGGFLMFVFLSGGLLLQRLPWVTSIYKRLIFGLIFLLLGTLCVMIGGKFGQLLWLSLGVVFHAIATSWIYPATIMITSKLVENENKTRSLKILYLVGYIGLGIPTLIIGQIANHLGMVNALFCGWVVGCCVVTYLLFAMKKFKPLLLK